MRQCHGSLQQLKRRTVALLIVKEHYSLCQWAFEYFRFGHFYPILIVPEILPIMHSTSRCAHCLKMGGLFTSLCVTVLPTLPHLSSFPSVFILAENCTGLFQHIFPLSRWKPVSSGGDYVVKYVSFWYKAPKPHKSGKRVLDKKIVSGTLHHLATHLPFSILKLHFPFVY